MITYKIISNITDEEKKRALRDPSHPNYKKSIFERALTSHRMKVGKRVKFRGRNTREGVITRIITDFDEVEWYRNQPMFIEIECERAQDCGWDLFVTHPRYIRRI